MYDDFLKGKDIVFGYVTPDKGGLTEAEFESFRSVYCGVCREIGKKASQVARMGLSYDITFLAMILSSALYEDTEIKEAGCLAHPIKKRAFYANDIAVGYAAEVGVLLQYLKLADDWHDDRSIKALFGMLMLYRGYRKVKRKHIKEYTAIKKRLDELSRLESELCGSVDMAADTFAGILEILFTPGLVKDDALRRTLAWLGYNLGRWIYIIDAYNDIESDRRSVSYNPLVISDHTDPGDIELSLTLTLGNIASAYELIGFKKNRELIGKMIYLGLKEKQKTILYGNNDEKKVMK